MFLKGYCIVQKFEYSVCAKEMPTPTHENPKTVAYNCIGGGYANPASISGIKKNALLRTLLYHRFLSITVVYFFFKVSGRRVIVDEGVCFLDVSPLQRLVCDKSPVAVI